MPKIIPEARHAWRFSSIQAALLLALLSGIQADALPLLQPIFSAQVWPFVSGGLALAVVVLRLLTQPELSQLREADARQAFAQEFATFARSGPLLSDRPTATDAERLEQARAAFTAALDDAAPQPPREARP